MRTGRRTLVWAGGMLGALVLALAFGEAAGWPFLRQYFQNMMTRAADVPVTLEGRFRLHLLWRPRLEIEHLTVAAGDGVAVPHLLDARTVDVGWQWGDVWRWQRGEVLRIQRLRAASLDANVVRDAAGHASWQIGPQRQAAPDDRATSLAGVPRFGALQVGRGLIRVNDQPFATQLTIALKGSEDAQGATYDATIDGRYRTLPLALVLHTTGTLPLMQDALDERAAATQLPLRVSGRVGAARLFFDGTASALLGERRLQGALKFSGPSLAQVGEPLGLTLPQTPPFAMDGTLAHANGVWQLRADHATIGRSRLGGEFRFDTRTAPPRLTGRLVGARLAFADLGPAIGQPVPAAAPKPKGPRATPRKVFPQRRFDVPSLAVMDADVQVAIDELDFGSDAVAPLGQLRTHVLLQGSVLRLLDMKAVVAGGSFGGDTQLDARNTPPRWSADVRFSGIDIAGWLQGVRSEKGRADAPRTTNTAALKQQRNAARQGGNQPVRAYVTGMLGGAVKASGRGRSTAEILATLDGQAQLLLRDGTISHLITEFAGLDVAQALGVWLRRDDPLPLRCARVDLQLQQGIVRPRVAVLDNKDSTVRVGGVVDLRNEQLALRVTTKPKDFSPLSLRSPVTIGGTLGQPVVGVEGVQLAARLLGALALGTAVGPLAALLPLVDTGQGEAGDPCVDTPRGSAPAASAPAARRAR